MVDRFDVHPHHLLRAVLVDRMVRDVLLELGVDPDDLLVTLGREWLAAADTIDIEEIEAVGIDLAMVLGALNPPFDQPTDWGGRHVTDATREVLVRSLAQRSLTHGSSVGAAHVLLGLMSSKDLIVSSTFRAHGLQGRTARGLVERWTRRAGSD